MLCETWTDELSDVDVEGYIRISQVRKRKKHSIRSSGGLEVYFKENIAKGIAVEEWLNEDGLNFRFQKEFFGWEKDVFLFFVYFKPKDSSRQDLDNELDCFDKLINQIANVSDRGNIIVAGDLNSRVAEKTEYDIDVIDDCIDDLNVFPPILYEHAFHYTDFVEKDMSLSRTNEDKHVNDYGTKLIQLCKSCDLAILNGRAGSDKGKGVTTFCGPRGESTVDFVICDKYVLKQVSRFGISDHVSFSDHKMVTFSLISCFDDTDTSTDQNVFNAKSFTKWKEANKGLFVNRINEENVITTANEILNTLTNNAHKDILDNAVDQLTDILIHAGADHKGKIGATRVTRKGEPWFDEECKLDKLMFFELMNQYSRNRNDENREIMCKQRSKYRQTCRRKKRCYNRKKATDLLSLSKSDPKKFWRELKGDKQRHAIVDINFNEHFKTLANKDTQLGQEGQAEVEQLSEREVIVIEELDIKVTIEELEKGIKELKKDKAAGHDAIVNEFIINAPCVVKCLLLAIFNNILLLEYFPDKWCVGSIVPIFKSGDKNEVNNYRGITLLSVVGKLFTKIMNTRLNKWAEKEHVLTESQFGFRKSKGTTDCIFMLQGLIEKLLGNGDNMFAVFIDYEKAFDFLDRGAIWAKLVKSGVSSKLIRIFQSMYEKMKLEVRHSSESVFFQSTAGILQGESTSPIFFSFFVNDLENSLNNEDVGIELNDILLKLLMYADDMVIFSKTIEGLQEGLNNLERYCKKWGISVNIRKTKVVVFKKGGRLGRDCVWRYKQETLEVVSVFKYLGIHISSTGNFASHFTESVNSARRALFSLKKMLAKNNEILPKMQLDLFNTMVSPILFYGCEVWGFSRADPIERFYLSFLKSLLCVKSSTPNCFVYGELGVYPLIIERKCRILKYWFKILKSDDNSLLKKLYNDMCLINMFYPKRVTWVSMLKNMLKQYGFGHVWMTHQVRCELSFLKEFRQRSYDMYLQTWQEEVDMTSNYRMYKHIKQSLQFEGYLWICNKSFRAAITKIRLSSHLFFIERGRWGRTKIDATDRICELCETMEDEYHCLIECPRFVNERKGCLPLNLRNRPSMYSFIQFIQCQEKEMYNKVGLLCFKIMKEYKNKYLLQ